MTAHGALELGLLTGAGWGLAYVLLARFWARERRLTSAGLLACGVAGALFGLLVVLPLATLTARQELARAPAPLALLIPWALAGGFVVYLKFRPAVSFLQAVLLVGQAALPTSSLGVAAGAVGGAMRAERQCFGNLRLIGTALMRYHREHGAWPPKARWVQELLPYLPYPSLYRCPVRPEQQYVYRPPGPDLKPSDPLISCPHGFVGRLVVLRRDLKAEERFIEPGAPSAAQGKTAGNRRRPGY
jgi:hypothetical protein